MSTFNFVQIQSFTQNKKNQIWDQKCLIWVFVLVITCLRGKFGINSLSSLFQNFEIETREISIFKN